jgi:hypothetical protein
VPRLPSGLRTKEDSLNPPTHKHAGTNLHLHPSPTANAQRTGRVLPTPLI